MVGGTEFQNLLSTGTWNTGRSKAKSPHPSNPVRANQSFKLEPLDAPDPTTERISSCCRPTQSRYPPPPSVEDEESAVAKEVNGSVISSGDEEPKHRGTVDQLPILLSLLENESKWVSEHEQHTSSEPEIHAVPERQAKAVPNEYEQNKERRFILVSDDEILSDGSDAQYPRAISSTAKPYSANTKRQLDPRTAAANSKDSNGQPELQRRKSRADLPRLETTGAVSRDRQSSPHSHLHRSRSATCVDHVAPPPKGTSGGRGSDDYFNVHPESARPAGHHGGDFLSPNVIKHSTKGRDRAYWDLNPGGSGRSSPRASSPGRELGRSHQSDGRQGRMPPLAPTAGSQRRFHSDMEVPQIRKTSERHGSYRDREDCDGGRVGAHGPSSPSIDRRHSPPAGPRLSKRESSPVRPARISSNAKIGGPRSSHASLSSARKEWEQQRDSSSDDLRDHSHRLERSRRERRKSTVIQDDRPSLLSPAGPRPPPSPRSKSRPPSPLPSPKATTSQARFPDLYPPPQQSTPSFHAPRDRRRPEIERPVSPLSSCSGSFELGEGTIGRPRASSRAPSIRSNASAASKPVNIPPPSQFAPSTNLPFPQAIASDDRKRQTTTMPPSPAWSRQSSQETVPYLGTSAAPCTPARNTPNTWRAESFNRYEDFRFTTSQQNATNLETQSAPLQPPPVPTVRSYRRYSEDVNTGALPGLPQCPRQVPSAGHTDWLTFSSPASSRRQFDSNFHICLSCYEQVFYHQPEFRDLFVESANNYRDITKKIACDLGTSPWYRIAWLMTLKYKLPDLRLLHGLANVDAKYHHKTTPCYGSQRVTRVWYSLTCPRRGGGISLVPDFTVCGPCSEAVQVLFPSLVGAFVAGPEPRPGRCSLHFTPNRTRFVTFFDLFERTHDRAVAMTEPPDMQRLAEGIRFWAGIEEWCVGDEPRRNAPWYIMAHVPEMTVCEACFFEVVYPHLGASVDAIGDDERDGQARTGSSNLVARNFYHKPQTIRSATVCQMASSSIRELFHRACEREDDGIAYLDSKVRERLGSM